MRKTNWSSGFPIREEVEDFAGKMRTFDITCFEGGLGYTVRAVEVGANGEGFEFGAYSETSPYSALGHLRDKMRREMSTRHLSLGRGGVQMSHDTMRGRITSDGERGVLLVVDGAPVSVDELANILSTHEGFTFELRIRDSLE